MNNAYGWYGERADGSTREERPAKSPASGADFAVDRKSFGFYHNLMGFPKVTVGEISGFALGGGFEMALMMDISVIARDTRIGMRPPGSSAPPWAVCTCSSIDSARCWPGGCC
jgi:enoyl-CoA hydratase/carnithine racemase